MIKMIALDLDGTLLTSDKTISKRNENALKKLHNSGIKIVLCTGRPINAIWRFIEQLGLVEDDDYTITFNGSLVIHNSDKQELFKQGIKKSDFDMIHRYCEQINAPLDILDYEQVYPLTDLKPSLYREQFHGNINFVSENFNDLSLENLYSKAVICDEVALMDEYQTNLTEQVKDQYHIVRSQPKIMEFLEKDMDKSVGLGHLLSNFGWDFSNLMAFGDAENDLGMLKAAGVGVVMENGKEDIKAAGDAVTLNNDADGVADFLEKYFEKNPVK